MPIKKEDLKVGHTYSFDGIMGLTCTILFVGKNTIVYTNHHGKEVWNAKDVFCLYHSEVKKKKYRPFKDITEFIKNKPELMIPGKDYCSFSFYCYTQYDKKISVGNMQYCTFQELFDDKHAKISYDDVNWQPFGIEVKE